MTNEIKKIEQGQLDEVVKGSELALQESDEIKKSYLPFIVQLAETQSQADKINFNNPTELDENIARELRLKTVKIRTGAEKLKEDRKRMYLLRGNLEQASYNVIAASCKITEEVFINVEKAREIAEKKRQEVLRVEREEKLKPYTEDYAMYPLGLMKDDAFEALYTSLRTAQEIRIAAEKKAEADRIKKEKAEAKAREEQRLENIRLRREAEEKDRLAEAERVKNAAILKAQQEKADKERMELLAKANEERKERERLAEIERKKDAKLLAEQVAKAEKERKEKERLEAEIEKHKRFEEAQKKIQEIAAKKALLAPDKEKLLDFAWIISSLIRPQLKSTEAITIMGNVNTLLGKVVVYIKENADKL